MSCGKNPFDAPIFYQQKQKGAEQRGSYIWALPRTVRVHPPKKPAFLVRNFFIYFLFGHSCTGQSPSQTHSAKCQRVSRHKIHQPWLSVVVETAGVQGKSLTTRTKRRARTSRGVKNKHKICTIPRFWMWVMLKGTVCVVFSISCRGGVGVGVVYVGEAEDPHCRSRLSRWTGRCLLVSLTAARRCLFAPTFRIFWKGKFARVLFLEDHPQDL